MDRGKANVPAAGAIVALLFKVIEERAEEGGIEIRQRQI
jgi:hypothetical protein